MNHTWLNDRLYIWETEDAWYLYRGCNCYGVKWKHEIHN
jgi:hypothetical protein